MRLPHLLRSGAPPMPGPTARPRARGAGADAGAPTSWRATLHLGLDDHLGRLTTIYGRLYADGFGGERLDHLVALARAWEARPSRVALAWSAPRTVLGVEVRHGWFTSPAAHLLPRESRRASVERWLPHGRAPIVLLLAATAEEGFGTRRPLALALARAGVGSLILENPLYGSRRPAGQRGGVLRTVADQFAMNLATVEEGCALVHTLHGDGVPVGVSGYSQGGVMAAFVAALSDAPVAAVPRAACNSTGPLFTTHVLSRCVRWEALAREAGDEAAARARLQDVLACVRVDRFPPPRDVHRAVVLACRHDAWIPLDEAAALHAHWRGGPAALARRGPRGRRRAAPGHPPGRRPGRPRPASPRLNCMTATVIPADRFVRTAWRRGRIPGSRCPQGGR